VKSVSLVLACLAVSCVTAPAAASALRSPAMRLPVSGPAAIRQIAEPSTHGSYIGPVSPAESVSLLIRLPGTHAAELDRLLAVLTAPDSLAPRYLTPQEYGRYFGADPVAFNRAVTSLRSAGFTIDDMPANRTDIIAHAPATRVEAFFQTPMDRRIEGRRIFFTARYEPVLPLVMTGALISGLDDYAQFHPLGLHLHAPNASSNVSWTPQDLAGGYDLNPLYAKGLDGKGVTIANSTSGAALPSDLTVFQNHFKLPLMALQSVPVGGPLSSNCGPNCGPEGFGESSLDADSVSAIAREATLVQVVAHTASNADFNKSYEYIVNNLGTTVHVVTTSWGICEREFKHTKSMQIDEQDFQQATAEGQFWFSASGDNGTDDCDDKGTKQSVDFPGSSPYVISVGGTVVQGTRVQGVVSAWSGETVWQWSTSGVGAGGGGKSIVYPKPSYQTGVTPADGTRDVPDVALMSDSVWISLNGQVSPDAVGTSEAAPMWAAFFAIIEQSKMSAGKPLGEPHKRLYALAKTAQYANLFHDIVSGNNGVPRGDDSSYPSRSFPGYNAVKNFDLATGWGSFNGAPLLEAY
jgi:kumamolisin